MLLAKYQSSLDLPLSEMKNLEVGFHWSLFQLVTRRAGKEMLHTNYQSSRPSSFRKEEFENGLLCSYIPTCDYQGGASFDPRGII